MFSQQDKVSFEYNVYGPIFKNWGKDKEDSMKGKIEHPIPQIWTFRFLIAVWKVYLSL